MGQDPDKSPKVVDLSEARKKQRTIRFGQGGKGASAKKAPGKSAGGRTVWTYVQFIVFLAAIAYFMQLCSSSSLF
jgi:hypothetical protein